MAGRPHIEPLMTRREISTLFGVSADTVTCWFRDERLTTVRTLGGHGRARKSEVLALFAAGQLPAVAPDPLSVPVASLWPGVPRGPVVTLQRRLEAAGIGTVRELTARTARELEADARLRPAQVAMVRLALYRADLALRGDVLDKQAV